MKRIFLLTALLLLLTYSCNSTLTQNRGAWGEYYFPLETDKFKTDNSPEWRTTGTNDKLDTFTNKWYSKHLYSLKEPVLYNLNDSIKVYRFTHLGTWSRPYLYRIEKKGGDIIINYKLSSGVGGYHTGRILKNKSKKLTDEQFKQVQEAFNKDNFWSLETHGERGLDGEEWILEAYDNGKYHVVTRWSPDDYGGNEFVELCNLFGQLYKETK